MKGWKTYLAALGMAAVGSGLVYAGQTEEGLGLITTAAAMAGLSAKGNRIEAVIKAAAEAAAQGKKPPTP